MGYGVAFLTREGIMHGKESGRSAVGRGGKLEIDGVAGNHINGWKFLLNFFLH
jgi:hypothetical protein